MLKLEKISKTREISIRMRKRDRICNPLFLRALAIAFAIHLIGFGIVSIESFKITGSDRWRPPAIVNADIDPNYNALTQLESGSNRRRSFLEPKESIPILPVMSEPILQRHIEYISQNSKVPSNPFRSLEKSLTEPKESESYLAMTEPFVIRVSGPLADKAITIEPKKLAKSREFGKDPGKDPKIARYRVQVEGKTGQVFWHEVAQSTQNPVLDLLAEQMLSQIRFKSEEIFVTEGEIEIQFNPSGLQ